ncbi:hypothetical protein MG290_01525 [Flavobacterium sp. CBA20B-1]|uniref:hypothetical protein n=1 Tax=unclassified Flavobacterium TaxID=196869 RepID=UPI002223F525|nr:MULTISPECIES: hypothetical protein [unclassified Flavobacterium]WCM42376.1 hypothetical protein MG290_01525 [Flavobacterium sp. CBA20B-1]
MTQLQIIEIIKQTLPQFDVNNEGDLIKAEKILKAYQKTDAALSHNEIEAFLDFYKNNGNKYEELLQEKNIHKLLADPAHQIVLADCVFFAKFKDLYEEFAVDFAEPVADYIQWNVKNNCWANLKNFYNNYHQIISFENRDLLIESITSKNNLIRTVIPYPEHYQLLLNEYKFSVDRNFFAIQSDIDAAYFNSEILDINNDIADYQSEHISSKPYLGRILIALGAFDAYTDDLKKILADNAKIGMSWASKKITKPKKKKVIVEKDYGKTAEWILLVIFYLVLCIIGYLIYTKFNSAFWILLVFETLLFAILNKKLNGHYKETSQVTNDSSFRRKLKKFSFKLLILQVYALAVAAILALGAALVGIVFLSGGVGIGGFLVIFWIIRATIKKN